MRDVERILRESGAIAFGIAPIGDGLPRKEVLRLQEWLSQGCNAGMAYMANHAHIRRNPRLLLDIFASSSASSKGEEPFEEGSIISLAFNYTPVEIRSAKLPQFATYAYGLDYHDVIRKRLQAAAAQLQAEYGGEWRVCVDSAPIAERFWAEHCGIGSRCENGLIAVGPYGTRVFLAEIVTSLNLEPLLATPHTPEWDCLHCGNCRRVCPAKALQEDSTVDARRCLSYLTIEHRGEWDEEGRAAMTTPSGARTLYGCDLCQDVCPLNHRKNPPTEIEEFTPRPGIMELSAERASTMTQEEFSTLFRGMAAKRTKLSGLHRNAANILRHFSVTRLTDNMVCGGENEQ